MSTTHIIQRPLVTERSTSLHGIGKYVFVVASSTTKNEMKKAIKAMYKVDVVSVNVINLPAKVKRFRGVKSQRPGYKKMIVTLKEGQKIDLGV